MGRKQLILKPGPNGKGICLCRASRIPKCIPEEVVKAILDADCLSDFLFLIKVEDFKQIGFLVGNVGYALDRNNPNTAYFIASRTSDGNYEISYTNTNDDEVSIDLSDLLKDSNYNAWEVDGDYYDDLTPYMGAINYDGRELSESNSHQWFRTLTVDGRALFFKGMFNGLSLESITYNPNGADLSTDAEAPMFDFKLTRVDKTQPLNVSNANNVFIVKKLVGVSSGAIAVYMPSESVPEPLRHFADSDKANTFPTMHTGYDGVCMVFSASVRSDKKAGSFTDAKALFTFGEPIKYINGVTAIELYYNSGVSAHDIFENNTYTINKGDIIVKSPDSEHNGYDLNIALADGSALSGKLDATYMLVNSDGADVAFEEKLLAVSEGATSVKVTVPEGKTVSIRQNGNESVDLVFTYSETMPDASYGWHDTVRDALIAYDESYGSYTFTEKDVSAMSDDSVFNVELMNAVELKNLSGSILASAGSKLIVLDTYENKVTVDYVESIQANTNLGGIDLVDLDTSGSTKYVLVSGPGASSSFKKISEATATNVNAIKAGVPETDEDLALKIASCAFGRAQLDWTDEINVTTSYTGSHHATIEREAGYLLDTFASAKSLDGAGTIYAITTVKVDGVFYLSNVVKHEFTTANEVFRFSNETPIYVTTNGIGNIAVWDSKVTNLSESLEDTIQSLGGEYAAASVVNTFDCSTLQQTSENSSSLSTTKVSDNRNGITVLSNVPATALLKNDAKLITVDVVDGLYRNPSVEEITADKATCELTKVSFDTTGNKVYALYSFNYMAVPRANELTMYDKVKAGVALTGITATDSSNIKSMLSAYSYLGGGSISVFMSGNVVISDYCLVESESSNNAFITGPFSYKVYNDDITNMGPGLKTMLAVKFKLVDGRYYIIDAYYSISGECGEITEGAGIKTYTDNSDAVLLMPGMALDGKFKLWNSNVEEPLFDGENNDLLYQRAIAYMRAKYPSKTILDDPFDCSILTEDTFTTLPGDFGNKLVVLKNPKENMVCRSGASCSSYVLGVKDGYIDTFGSEGNKAIHDRRNVSINNYDQNSKKIYIPQQGSSMLRIATSNDIEDYNYLCNGISINLDGDELADAIDKYLNAFIRLSKLTSTAINTTGIRKVYSAIIDNNSNPVFITGPFKYKVVYTNGEGESGKSYSAKGSQFITDTGAYSLFCLSLNPRGQVGSENTHKFNYSFAIDPSNLPDNVSLKVWRDGEAEPMLDWELEQSTTDPGTGPESESMSESTSESMSESMYVPASESMYVPASESMYVPASESCSE